MPFPWKKKKKNRVARISRIVADLQSPKRAGSLVVETGFPTSLIDLFVKNRSRFAKPESNTKKPLQPQVFDMPPPSAISLSTPLIPDTPSSGVFTAVPSEEALSVAALDTAKVDGREGGVLGSGPDVHRVGECDCGSGSKSVLASFLKMFVVVILIASVDKITVGITMSAFALLLLENVRKRVVSCFRPCSDANMKIIKLLRQRVSHCVWFQNLWFKTKKDCDDSESEAAVVEGGNIFVSEFVVGDECSTNSLSFHEIEIAETNDVVSACFEEACFVVGPELSDCVDGDRELGCPEMLEVSNEKVAVNSIEISQCVSKGSRRVWFKSMMVKRLVPKKLRTSKKEKREKKSEESNAEEEQGDAGKDGEENENGSSKIKPEFTREDGVDHGILYGKESSIVRVDEEVSVSSENNSNRIGNSSGNIIIIVLFVTALAGLVVGRFPALILTMTWCVMLKLVAATQGKSHNECACLQMFYFRNMIQEPLTVFGEFNRTSPVHAHI